MQLNTANEAEERTPIRHKLWITAPHIPTTHPHLVASSSRGRSLASLGRTPKLETLAYWRLQTDEWLQKLTEGLQM